MNKMLFSLKKKLGICMCFGYDILIYYKKKSSCMKFSEFPKT
jgi:hypothetical protein